MKGLRPTTGKVRDALFNILREDIKGACFLDLYAGTGAIGVEALRMGASEVVFVESSRALARGIQRLLLKEGLSERAEVSNKNALSFIQWAGAKDRGFDIIFLDPPYHTDEVIKALEAIDRWGILREEGVVIAEHFYKRQLPRRFDTLQKVRDYRYGDTVLTVYKKSYVMGNA